MKVLILAGGFGTRFSEETVMKPKPMIEIGEKPILWHIMKIYSHYGFNEFVILLGYKGYVIKEYFANYFLHQSDVTFDMANNNKMEIHNNSSEPWKITLLDTGTDTMTGGRVKRVEKFVNNETFMLTYGDGVADIDIKKLLEYHKSQKGYVTMTTVQQEGRFGTVETDSSNKITEFVEKPKGDGTWINGGFFVCEPQLFKYITEGDASVLEKAPLENLSRDGKLFAYKHYGYWRPMDSLRDKIVLENLWNNNQAKWKIWK